LRKRKLILDLNDKGKQPSVPQSILWWSQPKLASYYKAIVLGSNSIDKGDAPYFFKLRTSKFPRRA
jgi:hypothetical protein